MIKNYIMNHGMRLSMLNLFSKLTLLAVAETRFASVVVMLKRFLMVKRTLQSMVISDAWESYKDDNSGLAKHVREKNLCNQWWENVSYIVDFTKPIYVLWTPSGSSILGRIRSRLRNRISCNQEVRVQVSLLEPLWLIP
jgi:hypothetical protein